MNKSYQNNIKLGIFVALGLFIVIATVYYLGSQKNLFGSSMRVHAVFKNVSGLQVGNNVRLAGINIGTVENISITSDSTVVVSLLIDSKDGKFVKKDAIASISSEGVMGNKIVTISSGSASLGSVDEEDFITTVEPVDLDKVVAVLEETGRNAQTLTSNLIFISEQIKQGEGTIGRLLSDTILVAQLDNMINNFEKTGKNALIITNDFARMSRQTMAGEGALGKLIMDEGLAVNLESAIDSLNKAGSRVIEISENLAAFTDKLNNEQGAVGRLLQDTTLADNIDQTILSAQAAAEGLEETTDKLNSSWFFNFLFGGGKRRN